jgi:hypothetical protein
MLALGVGAQILISSNNTIGFSAKTAGGTANTAPYVFTITNNPFSADLFQLNLGVTNRFKVRNDGRIMTSAMWMYFNNSTNDLFGIDTSSRLRLGGDTIYFSSAGTTTEYIQLSDASNWFRIVQDGAETHRFFSNGNIAISGTRIVFDIIGGNEWIDMNDSTQQFRIGINGVVEMTLGATGFLVPNIWNSTTTSGANTVVQSDGRLRLSTSAKRFKKNIKTADWLADINLRPVTFESKESGTKRIGLIADEVVEELPDAGVYSDEGLVMNYEKDAVIALLLAKINRLEADVGLLKAAA